MNNLLENASLKGNSLPMLEKLVKQADNSMANHAIQVGSLKVYPNPTKDFININSSLNILSLQLVDMNGRTISSFDVNNYQMKYQRVLLHFVVLVLFELQTKH